MTGFLSLLIPSIILLIVFAWGILLGLRRVRVRFICVAVSFVLALIAAYMVKGVHYADLAVYLDTAMESANGIGADIWRFVQGSETIQQVLTASGGAILAPAVFFSVFFTLCIVSGVISYLIFLIVGIVGLIAGHQKRKRSPIRILLYSAAQVVLTVIVVMTLAVSYMDCLPSMVDAVAVAGGLPENSEYVEDVNVEEVQNAIRIANEAPLTVMYRSLGGRSLCQGLTSFEVAGQKTTLSDELGPIANFVAHLYTLTDSELEQYGPEESETVRRLNDCFGNSKLLPAVAGELIYGATDAWLDENGNGSFLGVKKPVMEGASATVFAETLDHLLTAFHGDARSTDALRADFSTLANVIEILANDGVFASFSDSDTDEMVQKLTSGTTVQRLIDELNKNSSLSILADDIKAIGMRALGTSLQLSAQDEETFYQFTGEIADVLNGVLAEGKTVEEQKTEIAGSIREAYEKNAGEELPLDDSVVIIYAEVLLNDLAEHDTVTSDDVANLFEAYTNQE